MDWLPAAAAAAVAFVWQRLSRAKKNEAGTDEAAKTPPPDVTWRKIVDKWMSGKYGWKWMLQAVLLLAAVLLLIVATLFVLQQIGVLDLLPLPGHAGQSKAIDVVGFNYLLLPLVFFSIILFSRSRSNDDTTTSAAGRARHHQRFAA